jgi:hypothetical protein
MDVYETTNANPVALGRFKPGYVDGGAGDGELDVTLATNLAGEPIRFTMNESLDNIVSSATLTMLNAIIGDEGEQQVGVMGEVKTEEDTAKWGTLYNSAPVEPNQLVWVTESGGGLGTCTTYWRVIGVTSYLDEEDIPYYEVQLEGMGQAVINCKFNAKTAGATKDALVIIKKSVWDNTREKFQVDSDNDGYITTEESPPGTNEEAISASSLLNGSRLIVETPSEWLAPFIAQIEAVGVDCGGAVDIGDWIPARRFYKDGESCWTVVEDLFGFNGKIARFTRDKKMVVLDLLSSVTGGGSWSYMPKETSFDGTPVYDQTDIDNPPLENATVGDFGQGLQLAYSKEGVFSWANVTGTIVKKNADGTWNAADETEPITIKVHSKAGDNILNGEEVTTTVEVSADYALTDPIMLENFGQKELYKSIIGARSAVYNSDKVALSVEVGMKISGSSKLGGATSIFITAFNRTTDAQQNTIETGLSGVRVFGSDSGETNDMGWS